ncbi:hypothetical protein [Spirosoma koreense]
MRYLFFFLLLVSVHTSLKAQQTNDNYKHYTINHSKLGKIEYHLDTINNKTEQPLLLWLDGSGCLPIRMIFTDGKNCCLFFNTVMIDEDSLSRHYHIVFISKPGVPYKEPDTIRVKDFDTFNLGQYIENERSGSKCANEFVQRNSLDWRAEAGAEVLNTILTKNLVPINKKRIIVAGHSEGAPVAAKLATLNPHATHVGCFAGPGLTHFYDFMLDARLKARAGLLTPEAAQGRVDSLMATVKSIMAQPQATNKFWEGETYKRWSSYAEPMADNLLKLRIPTYVASATLDKNTISESADYLPIIFAQQGKTNLTYRSCLACDHWFNDTRPNGQRLWKRYFNEFLQMANPK